VKSEKSPVKEAVKAGWSDDELDIDIIDEKDSDELKSTTQEEIVQQKIEPNQSKVEATTGWDDDDIIDI